MNFEETHDLIILSIFNNREIIDSSELKEKTKDTIGNGLITVEVDMKTRGLIDYYTTIHGVGKVQITQLGINKYKSLLKIKKQAGLRKIIVCTTLLASVISAGYSIAQYYKQSDTVQTIEQRQSPTTSGQPKKQKNIQESPTIKAVNAPPDSLRILKTDSSFQK